MSLTSAAAVAARMLESRNGRCLRHRREGGKGSEADGEMVCCMYVPLAYAPCPLSSMSVLRVLGAYVPRAQASRRCAMPCGRRICPSKSSTNGLSCIISLLPSSIPMAVWVYGFMHHLPPPIHPSSHTPIHPYTRAVRCDALSYVMTHVTARLCRCISGGCCCCCTSRHFALLRLLLCFLSSASTAIP